MWHPNYTQSIIYTWIQSTFWSTFCHNHSTILHPKCLPAGVTESVSVLCLPVHRLHFPCNSNNSFWLELVELLEEVSDVAPILQVQIQLHNTLHICQEKAKRDKFDLAITQDKKMLTIRSMWNLFQHWKQYYTKLWRGTITRYYLTL